ncbi:MAG: hypothetical protein COU35_00995 [Candidatus Magasanikbacteria bacterium CG10_big_fil_rev_8_21_14_0_10_47_10]|uniref:Excinuclease ABC subunit C n=1 Tax=Candidatus Magasanikbacteria bacterium CG10_big_fil_rev_8_21_14_0_10_47_10 TaxID=1974652 RepID=A0A2H0TRG6_9BACT|nr:MAG: hypothetical protein COU35_00995 [Candidatus Magasanikbacteria bacterium CG10_big_fil_rev_8_21_14_0_10_47_10]
MNNGGQNVFLCYNYSSMKQEVLRKKARSLPDAPGIYLFYSISGDLIYVGKATSLRDRVSSYFVGARSSRPIEQFSYLINTIKVQQTDSVLEAVIAEANAIKKYQPKYNVLGKDNKSWNYIAVTDETYPQVRTIRQHEYNHVRDAKYLYVFGPYPGLNTRETVKLLRRMFQFSTCQKQAMQNKKKGTHKPCLYYQIHECLGVCINEISSAEYKKKVILPLARFLNGGKKSLIRTLEQRMKSASKDKEYEEAARLRDQVAQLTRIHDIAILNKSFFEHSPAAESLPSRIEGYDISNLGATGAVGSMVVFDAGGPVKSEYRKFKIRRVKGQSDVDALAEVLARRLKHNEWPLPDVFLIDGGKPQVNRAKKILD